MRFNIPPIREPVFDAYVEIQQKDGRKLRLPIVFQKTTRPWAEFFSNLSRQANTGAEAEIAEDLFAGISPEPPAHRSTESDLFGSQTSAPARAASAEDPFGALPQPPKLDSFARHFLLMGA